ncbi:UNVERIFIED_CONTAM: 60S ribosomal protein L4 [Trichonephila clavipes]
MHKMKSTDLTRLLKDARIRKAIRPPKTRVFRRIKKKNPLRNAKAMLKLNPYSILLVRKKRRQQLLLKKRGIADAEGKEKKKGDAAKKEKVAAKKKGKVEQKKKPAGDAKAKKEVKAKAKK